jgi:putative glutamine amidotransferase
MTQTDRPRIVVTVTVPARHPDPVLAARKNQLYAEGVERHGGEACVIDGASSRDERAAAFAAMDGLLLTGGADIDPARYGAPNLGSVDIEPERDELEAEAWAAAETAGLPVLGICRGFQAINVFLGGSLLQDVPGHAGPGWGTGPARIHPFRLAGGTRLAWIIVAGAAAGLTVNTYHHQGVRATDLAPGLVATGWAASEAGDLVEAFERPGSRFVVGLQCHPERTESTPAEFEALWRAFIEACRAGISGPRDEGLSESRNPGGPVRAASTATIARP